MPLRFARIEDQNRIEDMLAYCFPDMRPHIEQRRAEQAAGRMPAETTESLRRKEEQLACVLLKEEADGRIGQHVQIVPLTIHLDGTRQKMAGIGAVASLPEYRYGGGVMELLRWSLQIMRERGFVFSELAPFSFAFYRKCGWEWGFRWHELEIPMKELERFKADTGAFTALTARDRKRALAVRNAHASRFNGGEYDAATEENDEAGTGEGRDEEQDAFPRKGRLCYGVEGADGALDGYADFEIRDGALRCRDFFYRSHQAKRQLLHFFYRHNSQAQRVVLTVPESDTLPHLLSDQYLDVKARAGMMVRIVDVAAAVACVAAPVEDVAPLVLQVTDEAAPWNQGNWQLSSSGDRLHAERVENREPDCVISIQRLSQLVYGFLSGQDVIDGGMSEWRNEAAQNAFSRMFRRRPTAQWESF